MRNTLLYIIALAAALVVSCEDKDEPSSPAVARRTVMYYGAAENSLSTFIFSDVMEMVAGAKSIPSDCRLLVYLDDRRGNPRILEVSRERGDTVSLYRYGSNECCAEPEVMAGVLERMRSLAPAEEYALVIGSHGSGWLPGEHAQHGAAPRRIIVVDSNYKNGGGVCKMGVDELAEALSRGPKLSFLFMDACLMQGVETAYALRRVTDYIISSPAEIPAHGATYDRVMTRFFSFPFDAAALAREYYDCEREQWEANDGRKGGGVVMSVVRTCELDSLAAATRRLLAGSSLTRVEGQRYWLFSTQDSKGSSREFPDSHDLLDAMRQFADSPGYEDWERQLRRTVPCCAATRYWDSVCDALENWSSGFAYGLRGEILDPSAICGLSVFIPQAKYEPYGKTWNEDIHATEWWQAVH